MRQRHGPLLGALALAAWCGWVSGFPRSSSAAEVTWVVSLAIVVAAGAAFWRGRRGARVGWHLAPADPWPRSGRGGAGPAWRGMAPWLVLIALATAWDVLGIDTGPHSSHLTISALSQAFRPLNALLLLVWMLVGIGYAAARARVPLGDARETLGLGPSAQAAQPQLAAGWGAGLVSATAAHGHAVAPALLLPSNRAVGVAFWIGVLVATVAVDLIARRSAGRVATAGDFARFISTSPVANVALVAAWAFAGYHLFAR
ncbi:MAG TPA: hypothetical protein VG346_14630 [Acidimicrobiales bacterium]|nr:hypothetical protein [Acidimicrobiales bacterium]